MNDDLTTISVSYDSKEILIELDPFDDNVYDTFINILSEKLGEHNILNNFKIMALNTNTPYLLIDDNNFWNILHEERKEEQLKLFMNKLDNNENNDEEENNDELFLGGMKSSNINNNNDFDDFNEEDFDQKEKSFEEKDEQEINEKEKEKEKEDNKNNIKIGEDENNNELKQTEDTNNDLILNKDENIMNKNNPINILSLDNNNNNNNIQEDEKEKDKIILKEEEENKSIEEKIQNTQKEDSTKNEKNSENILLKNTFAEEICSICEEHLESKKYICIICEDIILCNKCGKKHEHPCFIYKTPFISSLEESYNFIKKNYSFHSIKKNHRNISLYLYGDQNICLRPNKGALIPIKIINNSNSITINSQDIIILIKGNKFINISYDSTSKFKIAPNTFYVLKLKCITPNKIIKENINLELYGINYFFKDNKYPKINFTIEINEDKDEENLNFKLCFNEMAILYNKEHKNILISLIENELKGYKIDEFIDLVINFNWDIKKVLKLIASYKENQKEN